MTQTFTPTCDGLINKVTVKVVNISADLGNMLLFINGEQVASVPSSSVNSLLEIPLTPYLVKAGTTYSIMIRPSNNNILRAIFVAKGGNPYDGGSIPDVPPGDFDLLMRIDGCPLNTINSNSIIETNTSEIFKATQSITLEPGFHAEEGSNFLATIVVCNNNITANLNSRSQLKIDRPVRKIEDKLNAKIYPNPVQDVLNIEVAKSGAGFDLELYDLTGRQLNTWRLKNNQTTISVNYLEAGIYFLRIDKTLTRKVIIGKN